MIGIGVNLWVAARATGQPLPITGTGPTLAALTDGDTLSGAVTWGSYTAADGYTLAGTTTREMSLDGGGTWVAYDGAHVADYGETIRLRETVSTTTGETRAFASAAQVVADAGAHRAQSRMVAWTGPQDGAIPAAATDRLVVTIGMHPSDVRAAMGLTRDEVAA